MSAVPPSPTSHTLATLALAVVAVAVAAVLALVLAAPVRAETAPRAGTPADPRFGELFRLPIGARGVEPSATREAADGHEVRLVGSRSR